ncbi:MAG: hypothetical protein M5U34_37750 [Chloroflexi bacterium]|nr:hypothetical protein [Chloroflexota bacterium]
MAEIAPIMRQAIAEEHDLQLYGVVLVQPRAIPKTSSGKTQRGKHASYIFPATSKLLGKMFPIYWLHKQSRLHRYQKYLEKLS